MCVTCPTSFFCMWVGIQLSTSLIGKIVPSPSNCVGTVIENQLTLNARSHFCSVSSTAVIFVCGLLSVCLDS